MLLGKNNREKDSEEFIAIFSTFRIDVPVEMNSEVQRGGGSACHPAVTLLNHSTWNADCLLLQFDNIPVTQRNTIHVGIASCGGLHWALDAFRLDTFFLGMRKKARKILVSSYAF